MRALLGWLSLRLKAVVIGFVAILAAFLGVSLFAVDATLSWVAPTTLENGEPLTDLAGYKVYHSLNGGQFVEIADIPPATTYLHGDLEDGEHCYRVTAYRVVGGIVRESEPSNTACKLVDTARPSPPTGMAVQ